MRRDGIEMMGEETRGHRESGVSGAIGVLLMHPRRRSQASRSYVTIAKGGV